MPVFKRADQTIFFIHIPKCGGHSIEVMFKKSGWDPAYRNIRPDRYIAISPQHYHASIYEAVFDLTKFDLIFTIVRDPVDRFVSEFKFRNKKRIKNDLPVDINKWAMNALDRYLENPRMYDNHLRPQVEFVTSSATLYAFEHLSRAMDDLAERFGDDFEPLPHLHKGEGGDYRNLLSDTVRRRLEEIYSEDYRLWESAFKARH